MELSYQLHGPADLPLTKDSPIPIEERMAGPHWPSGILNTQIQCILIKIHVYRSAGFRNAITYLNVTE